MALLFTVIGKTDDPELLAEEQYYMTCHRLGIDCQVAAKKHFKDQNWQDGLFHDMDMLSGRECKGIKPAAN